MMICHFKISKEKTEMEYLQSYFLNSSRHDIYKILKFYFQIHDQAHLKEHLDQISHLLEY